MNPEHGDDSTEKKSKSQRKREMLALQALGEQLTGLSVDQINTIEMAEDLREAVLFAKTMKKNESLRRQMQYIGTLMRDVDSEPIRKALDEIGKGRRHDAHAFRKIEQLRDGLIDGGDRLLEDIFKEFPEVDRQRLRRLVLNARKEKLDSKPPKSSRALFRYLRELAQI